MEFHFMSAPLPLATSLFLLSGVSLCSSFLYVYIMPLDRQVRWLKRILVLHTSMSTTVSASLRACCQTEKFWDWKEEGLVFDKSSLTSIHI